MASARSTTTAGGVSFTDNGGSSITAGNTNQNDQRTKFLTMKYGQSQIKQIQKRLKIEFWIDTKLKELYEVDERSGETYPCDLDLDEIIDLESREERRQFLEEMLSDCRQPVTEFIEEILKRLDAL